nr:unnamed protein product [Callosobruchus analis]
MRIISIWLAVTIQCLMASEKCEILHGKGWRYLHSTDHWIGEWRTSCDGIFSPEIKCNYSGAGSYPDASQLCDRSHINLRFYSDKIAVLPGSAFTTGFEVWKMYLENLGITKITPGAFNHQSSIHSIFLSKNNLYQIGDGVFNSLMSLEELDLSENEISDITEDAFSGVPLKQLNVSYNNISSIPYSLTNVQVLDISHNCIKSIPSRMFATSSLNISDNHIDKINISYFPNITTLYAANNLIENIEIANTTLRELDLRDNKLTIIPMDLKELKVLNVRGNQISKLPDKVLIARNLQKLILSGNNVSFIPVQYFGELGNLEVLDLSKNSLTAFSFGTFDTMQSLKTLNISYNRFKILPIYTFHSIKGLTDLYFSHNGLTEVNVYDLLTHLPKLRMVDMRGNLFTCHSLLEICDNLQKHDVLFERGSFTGGNNIHGMNCSDSYDLINVKSKSKIPETNEAYATLLNYFNKEFRNSNFVQYLENLRNGGVGTEGFMLLSNLTEIFTNIDEQIAEIVKSTRAQENSLEKLVGKVTQTNIGHGIPYQVLTKYSNALDDIVKILRQIVNYTEFGGVSRNQELKEPPSVRLDTNQRSSDTNFIQRQILGMVKQIYTKQNFEQQQTENATSKGSTLVLVYIAVMLTIMVGYVIVSCMERIAKQKSDMELARLAECQPDSANS